MAYRRYFDPAQVESDQKDLVISQLKAELFELKNSERDYNQLSSQLNNLEHKYQLLQEENIRLEKERRSKVDNNQKQLNGLKDDIDIMKSDIRNQNIDLQELRSDNTALREMAEFRASEISKLKAELTDILQRSRRLQDDNQKLAEHCRTMKEEKKNLVTDADQLTATADQFLAKNKNLEKQVKVLQSEDQKLEKQLLGLQKENEQMNVDLKMKSDQILETERALQENERVREQLQQELYNLERDADKNKNEVQVNQGNYQNEISKGKDLISKLTNIETTIRSKELHIDDLQNNFESLKQKNFHLLEENKELNQEINRNISIIEDLTHINQDLIKEVQAFQEQDDKALQILNRKEAQNDVIAKSNQRISQSTYAIAHLIKRPQEQ